MSRGALAEGLPEPEAAPSAEPAGAPSPEGQSLPSQPAPAASPEPQPLSTPTETPSPEPSSAPTPTPTPTPSETPPSPKSPRKRHDHHAWQGPPLWPGRFVAIRGGLSGDLLLLPFGSAGTAGSMSSYFDLAPFLGFELGYCETHWGVSVSFDGAPFGLIPAAVFSSPPMHYVLAVNLNYLPNQKLRWVFGVEPLNLSYANLANGGSATVHGVGLRAGLHYRLSDPGPTNSWEAFGILSAGVMRETDLDDANGNVTALDFTSPGVAGSFTGYFSGMAGVQWTFSL